MSEIRIGKFSSLFNVKPSTVRYYINKGLLVPRKNNGQYLFDHHCRTDMAEIMQLKGIYFSLTDILQILTLRRISNLNSPDDIGPIIEMLHCHRDFLNNKLISSKENLACLEAVLSNRGDVNEIK